LAKIEVATIIGTIQSKFTYFPYLSEKWKKNCEDERLLGVSMTGIFDNPLTSGKVSPTKLISLLQKLKAHTEVINKEWSEKIGINPSKSITCVKPEGTTSCLAGCASGLHPQYAPYFIRRVRIDKKDPVYNLMKDQGVPCEDCVINPDNQAVFSFPMKSSNMTMTSRNLDAITHMILWKIYQDYYCHHKPSVTVNYNDNEFLLLGQWVYEYFDGISGVSFLPKTEHTYQQAPFEEISEEVYNTFPYVDVDFSVLPSYEKSDTTTSSHSFACTANGCELTDITTG
jgi:ribonucleoside-diphosphate reductase alpha chain